MRCEHITPVPGQATGLQCIGTAAALIATEDGQGNRRMMYWCKGDTRMFMEHAHRSGTTFAVIPIKDAWTEDSDDAPRDGANPAG